MVVLISLIKSLIGSFLIFFKYCSFVIGLKKLVILDLDSLATCFTTTGATCSTTCSTIATRKDTSLMLQ